jgi:hypothetical protein
MAGALCSDARDRDQTAESICRTDFTLVPARSGAYRP